MRLRWRPSSSPCDSLTKQGWVPLEKRVGIRLFWESVTPKSPRGGGAWPLQPFDFIHTSAIMEQADFCANPNPCTVRVRFTPRAPYHSPPTYPTMHPTYPTAHTHEPTAYTHQQSYTLPSLRRHIHVRNMEFIFAGKSECKQMSRQLLFNLARPHSSALEMGYPVVSNVASQ